MNGDSLIITALERISKILNKTLGANLDWIDDTALHTHNYYSFTAATDVVIATATGNSSKGTILTKTIPAGTTIYMTCTDITLTSGTLIGYYF